MLKPWKEEFRNRIAPKLPLRGLRNLAKALARESTYVLRGDTLQYLNGAACPVAYAFLKSGRRLGSTDIHLKFDTVFEDEEGSPDLHVQSCFIRSWDDGQISYKELQKEVEREISRRSPNRIVSFA